MNKIFYHKANLLFVVLLIVWSGFMLAYLIPVFFSLCELTYHQRYELLYGSWSLHGIQEMFLCPILHTAFNILFTVLVTVFSVLFIFGKASSETVLGTIILMQNIVLILLELRQWFLSHEITFFLYYIVVVIAIMCFIVIYVRKMGLYLCLSILAILQAIRFIFQIVVYSAVILEIGLLYFFQYYGGCIVSLILFWLLHFAQCKQKYCLLINPDNESSNKM